MLTCIAPRTDFPVHRVAWTPNAWQLAHEPALSEQQEQPRIKGNATGCGRDAGTACSMLFARIAPHTHLRNLLMLAVQGGRSGVEGPLLSTAQRVSYGLATVGARYLWTRLSLLAAAQHWGDAPADSWMTHGWSMLRWTEIAYRLASVVNLYVFLSQGMYRYVVLLPNKEPLAATVLGTGC